jgi:predicted MPP superfamily phosphohydrolase
MFHTIITLAYVIPNIYVFLRINQLFINKGYRLYYTLIYIFLVLIYPAGNFISDRVDGFIASVVDPVANYILPFWLYLFLFILLLDILLLINRMVKFIPADKLKSTRFKFAGLSLILVLASCVVIAGIINFNTIRTSEYKIDIPARSSGIEHLKIAFVADFHLQKGTNVHFVERFAQKIEIIKPDLMIFGGDNVEGDRADENLVPYEKILASIKARYGVYAVPGNHEHYAGQDKGNFFDRSGMTVLSDSIVFPGNLFNLAGRNDSHITTRKTIGELLKSVKDSLPVILVDHRPTEIEEVSKTHVDVQLSGHTHNGQLFPINLITKKIYILTWGYKKILNTHFFVTSGIRLWGPPVRTTARSEIMVIDITFLKDGKQ